MTRQEAHALAARIQAVLTRETGHDCRQGVAVDRVVETYRVHVYGTRPRTWVLYRACHWTRRN